MDSGDVGVGTGQENFPCSPRNTVLIDQRGIPTHECLNCGGNVFLIRAVFENYDIASWFLDGNCAECGSPVTVPCPVDDPDSNI